MSMIVCPSLPAVPSGWFVADCCVSGGDLREHIQGLLRLSGGQLCLRLAPVYMEFPLPCPSGEGVLLDPETLRSRYDGSPCYYSGALCMEYFTTLREGRLYAFLYDSPDSLRAKYKLAADCHVPRVLIEDPALRRMLAGPGQ